MPRGVYDRSKLKKKVGRPAKTEVKQKRKYTRRAVSADPAPIADVGEAVQGIEKQTDMLDYSLLNQLTTLSSVQTQNTELRGRLDALMLKVADKLVSSVSEPIKAFEAEKPQKAQKATKAAKVEVESKVETKEEVKAEAADASEKNGKHTVLPAPVPFIAVPTSV